MSTPLSKSPQNRSIALMISFLILTFNKFVTEHRFEVKTFKFTSVLFSSELFYIFSDKQFHKSNNLTNSLQKNIQIFLFILFSSEYKICFSFQQQQHDNHGLKNEWCKSISKQNKMSRKYLGMS